MSMSLRLKGTTGRSLLKKAIPVARAPREQLERKVHKDLKVQLARKARLAQRGQQGRPEQPVPQDLKVRLAPQDHRDKRVRLAQLVHKDRREHRQTSRR